MVLSQRDPLPMDIVQHIALYLDENGSYGTLAAVALCSRSTHETLTPLLYSTLVIRGSKSLALFDFSETSLEDITNARSTPVASLDWLVRRLWTLSKVNTLLIDRLPSDHHSRSLHVMTQVTPLPLLPNVGTVHILPNTTDHLRSYISDDYRTSSNPLFLRALTALCWPTKLEISFPVIPSQEWEEKQGALAQGGYKLVARTRQLQKEGWSSLREMEIHNIVHQVTPSLPGCRNTYHFASHNIAYPTGLGEDIPGPSWHVRAWQMMVSIKSVFPSGTDVRTVLRGTSWAFDNVIGHLSSCEDEVEWKGENDVLGHIGGTLEMDLSHDLPMRQGFEVEMLGDLLDRIRLR